MDEHGWQVPDAASSEFEMHALLTALVRMLKPEVIVETGFHRGYGAAALIRGACENGAGHVFSCDTNPVYLGEAMDRARSAYWAGRGVCDSFELKICRGVELLPLQRADFVFIDSDYACRMDEFALVKAGATVVMHDTRISYAEPIPPLGPLITSLGGVCFDTYRGFGIIRKA